MPASKVKNLSSLFRKSAAKLTQAKAAAAEDVALKQFVSSIDSFSTSPSPIAQSHLVNSSSEGKPLSSIVICDESTKQLAREISSLLPSDVDVEHKAHDTQSPFGGKFLDNGLEIPWFSRISENSISLRRKEVSRERKQKWVSKNTQTSRFDRLVRTCAAILGPDTVVQVFGKLGRETGLKEYNALIRICIEEARKTDDEENSLEQIYKAYQLFTSMREMGFQIEEETYGPLLMYLIDFGLVDEFCLFFEFIRGENPNSLAKLAYYEMLLWIKVDNEDKIEELCYNVALDDSHEKCHFQEKYFLALCESNRKRDSLRVLQSFDIIKMSSIHSALNIFTSLGKLSMEDFAEKFLVELKANDTNGGTISSFICNYAISLPNLAVEEIVLRFKNLHTELNVTPTLQQYEKLVRYCCESFKVHVALDIIDQMFEAGLTLSAETFRCILDACEELCEYNLVHRIYSMICCYDLRPNSESVRMMIDLSVRMKDFEGAYAMIENLQKMNLRPTAGMYNAIIAGYFREKKAHNAHLVLKEMEKADVKPDSQTFSYLLGNCNCENDIIKFFDQMTTSGVQATKNVYMALINAYAACGEFEKAKEVILDKGIPIKSLNEVRSVLVSALASHGQMIDALNILEEIRKSDGNLEPKAIFYLIEHLQSKGELNRLLQLLEELKNTDLWVDASFKVIEYCVHHKHLRSAIDLLKQLKAKFKTDDVATEVLFDEIFCHVAEDESPDVQFGLNLLQAFKKELVLRPSRRSLDFLLSACVNAKDLQSCFLVWQEYQTAGLPYNVLSFVRMYQALLALGDTVSAAKMLNKIPKDDPHVCCFIRECQATYSRSTSARSKKKKKNVIAETVRMFDKLAPQSER